ncbi:MAG TPA: hypothetical protein VIV57_22850, partial [Anaeromyxobacter sp.]
MDSEAAARHIQRLHVTPGALVRFLRSPKLVFAVLAFAAIYCGAAAWAPWSLPGGAPPPAWAAAIGLDHPFTAAPFLACVSLIFASTLACTWGRRERIRAILAGELPPSAVALAPSAADARAFLEARGFRGRGDVLRRHGWALWGGWVLHVGLLVLIAAVVVQQAFQDGGAFDLSEGETARLSQPGVAFARERGPLAPASPPDLEVGLERFDPYLHQEGYAPDRASRLVVALPGAPPRSVTLDRAEGARLGAVEIFQAIPAGLSLHVDIDGMGRRSIHLAAESERVAAARLADPAGRAARFVLTAERRLDDRLGTGRLRVELESEGGRLDVEPGVPFSFGGREARLVSVGRWGRFTWSRSPGMAGVLAGFALVVLGCALLAFPAGVARLGPPGAGAAATVYQ